MFGIFWIAIKQMIQRDRIINYIGPFNDFTGKIFVKFDFFKLGEFLLEFFYIDFVVGINVIEIFV